MQFAPLGQLRAYQLWPLWQVWRESYPRVEEQPPLPPGLEVELGSVMPQFRLSFGTGAPPMNRHWFLSQDESRLVQLQQDRLIVNWRISDPPTEYPRYGQLRETLVQRFADLELVTGELGFGSPQISQLEISYVNVLPEIPEWGGGGHELLRSWSSDTAHHLGQPEESRFALVYRVPDLGRPPSRLYLSLEPSPEIPRREVFTATVRGAPEGNDIQSAVRFLDEAHWHVVTSFTELTAEPMHDLWRKRG